jgi:uncharacterized protein YcfJ
MKQEMKRQAESLLQQVPEVHRNRGTAAGAGAVVGGIVGSIAGGPVGAAVGALELQRKSGHFV